MGGNKVQEFKQHQISGAMIVSMTFVEIEKECGMTTIEVQKFQAIIVKTKKGGCGIEPEVDTDTMPLPSVEGGEGGGSTNNEGPNKAAIGILIGGAVVAGGVGYLAWRKHQNSKQEQEEEDPAQESQQEESMGGDDSEETPPSITHPSTYTQLEVTFFLIAIGLETKIPAFEEKQIDGKMLVSLTKKELEVELGCSSIQVRKISVALEFSIEISEKSPPSPTCGSGSGSSSSDGKPPQNYTEVEVCLVLVAVGLGKKVKEFKKYQVSGAMVVSMTKVELEQECGMTSIEVTKVKGVIVKC